MRFISRTTFRVVFALSALLLLSACGSELTGINAPEAVEADQTFEVSVTHQISGEDGDSDAPGGADTASGVDTPYGALVFGIFVPLDWSGSPTGNYQGIWDGIPVDFEMVLQEGLPVTNFVAYLESLDEPPPEGSIEFFSISDCAAVIADIEDETSDYQLLFYQSTADLSQEPGAIGGDTGEFFFELTSGGVEEENTIVAIHGMVFGGPFSIDAGAVAGAVAPEGEDFQEVLGCSWFPDTDLSNPEDGYIPDAEFAVIKQFVLASEPVPMMGGVMIAILSLLLAGAGILVGRRRKSGHTG